MTEDESRSLSSRTPWPTTSRCCRRYSTTRIPGRNAPRRSAPSIMASAIRSLYDPVGLKYSSFTKTSAEPRVTSRCRCTSGVRPIVRSTESTAAGNEIMEVDYSTTSSGEFPSTWAKEGWPPPGEGKRRRDQDFVRPGSAIAGQAAGGRGEVGGAGCWPAVRRSPPSTARHRPKPFDSAAAIATTSGDVRCASAYRFRAEVSSETFRSVKRPLATASLTITPNLRALGVGQRRLPPEGSSRSSTVAWTTGKQVRAFRVHLQHATDDIALSGSGDVGCPDREPRGA